MIPLLRRIGRADAVASGVVLVGAAAAACLIFVATVRGPGMEPDSLMYILLARSLKHGTGFAVWGEPFTHFPPAYPWLLRVAGIVGPETLGRADLLLAGLCALNTLLVAWAAHVSAAGARWAAPVAVLLFVGSPPMTTVHAMVWSEAPFMALFLLALVSLSSYASQGRGAAWVAGAGCVALGILTRYAGVALVPLALTAAFLGAGRRRSHRGAGVAAMGLATLGPSGLWLVRNAMLAGSVANRAAAFHPMGLGHLEQLRTSVAASWGHAGWPGGLVALAALIAGIVRLVPGLRDGQVKEPGGRSLVLAGLAAFGGLCYATLLVLSLTFADADTPLDVRILAPLHVISVVLVAALPSAFCEKRPRLAVAAWLALGLLGVANLPGAAAEAVRMSEGEGFSHDYWRRSPTLAFARSLAPGQKIYTNGPEIVAFFAGRHSLDVPAQWSRTSLLPEPGFAHRFAAFCADLTKPGTVLVQLDGVGWRWQLPTPYEIESTCHVTPRFRFADGAVYGPT